MISEGAKYYDADGDSVIIDPSKLNVIETKLNGTSKFIVDSVGWIGSGVPAPLYPLHVAGIGVSQVIANYYGDGAGYARVTLNTASDEDTQLSFQNAGLTKWSIGNEGNANALHFNNGSGAFNATSEMTILSTGNVGIGTTTPYAQLSQEGATPIHYLTDSDVNLTRSSLAQAIDTSAIVFDASASAPTISVKNSIGLGYTLEPIGLGGLSVSASVDGVFRVNTTSAAGNPSFSLNQAGNVRAYFQFVNSSKDIAWVNALGAHTFWANNVKTFILNSGGNVNIGVPTAVDQQSPDLIITGDADSDGTDLTQSAMSISLQSKSDPTLTRYSFTNSYAGGKGYLFDQAINYGVEAQADDDYEVSMPGITALSAGLTVTFIANTANTDGATLEITEVGDVDALVIAEAASVATALATGEILAGQVVTAVFDGTNWQIISRLANDRN